MSVSDYTEYILRFSYGKDSFKALDVICTRGLPLDRITTTDVWATDTVPAWLPPMQEFKDRMDEWIWDKYRLHVEHLCARNKDGSKRTYEQMFYHVPVRRSQSVQVEREREAIRPQSRSIECRERLPDSHPTRDTTGARNSRFVDGTIKGFPLPTGITYCQKLKIRGTGYQRVPSLQEGERGQVVSGSQDSSKTVFSKERPTRRGKTNIVEYLGIAADEPDRHGQLDAKKRAPLVEFGIEEDLCGLYCQYAGCLAPTYETSCRDGCWFCHNQGVDQLRNLWRNYPDHWALLMKWDLDSPVSFKADGHTVHDFDRRFRMEEDGVVPMDNTFRWYAVDNCISMFDLLRE